tara:strand:+ start:288 stop:401 length:114 start_codon:yes stop_codon:yes gene_type:complete
MEREEGGREGRSEDVGSGVRKGFRGIELKIVRYVHDE